MNANLIEFARCDESVACAAYEAEVAANEAELASGDTVPCPPPAPALDEFPY
jgi:hypothetical protein